MLKIRVFWRIPHLARRVSNARSRVTRTLNFKLLNFFFELEAGELLNCVTLNDEICLKKSKFCEILQKFAQKKFGDFLQNFWIWSGAKECRSCRAWKMLKNAPTLAIVAVHTEENEPPRILIWNTTNIYIHYLEPRNGCTSARVTTTPEDPGSTW